MSKINFVDILFQNQSALPEIIREELADIKANFGDERRSEINPFGGDIADEDLIPRNAKWSLPDSGGYIKKNPQPTNTDYQAQRRRPQQNRQRQPKTATLSKPSFVATRMII